METHGGGRGPVQKTSRIAAIGAVENDGHGGHKVCPRPHISLGFGLGFHRIQENWGSRVSVPQEPKNLKLNRMNLGRTAPKHA